MRQLPLIAPTRTVTTELKGKGKGKATQWESDDDDDDDAYLTSHDYATPDRPRSRNEDRNGEAGFRDGDVEDEEQMYG